MTTVANVRKSESSHFYLPDGTPFYEVPYKDKNRGMRPANLADAKLVGALPSVTTILKVLNKPSLEQWKQEQACLAVLTTPKKEGESLDDFVHRVLAVERAQEAEAKIAADKGTAIHDAIACALTGKPFDKAWVPYVKAALSTLESLGKVQWVEKVLVGDGYAGKADVLVGNDLHLVVLDWKTSKKLPNNSYAEHKIQTAMYAKALGKSADTHIITGNLYLSTVLPGSSSLSLQEDWMETYEEAAKHLIKLWQHLHSYRP